MGRIADATRDIAMPQQKRAQMLAFDKEFSALEAKVKALELENQNLQAEVNPLKREVEGLKKQVEQKQSPSHELDPTEIEMLKLLASIPGGVTSPQFAQHLGIHPARVEHFLNLLLGKKFILAILVMGGHARYQLDHRGNEYLVKSDLV